MHELSRGTSAYKFVPVNGRGSYQRYSELARLLFDQFSSSTNLKDITGLGVKYTFHLRAYNPSTTRRRIVCHARHRLQTFDSGDDREMKS